MNNRVSLVVYALGLLLTAGTLAAGCSGNASDTYQDFVERRDELIARMVCKSTFHCDARPPGQTPYASEQECRNNVKEDAPTLFDTASVAPAQSRNEGRIVYQSGEAKNCLQKLEEMSNSRSCVEISSAHLNIDACDSVLQGQVDSGQPCRLGTFECKGDMVCENANPDTCYGTCNAADDGENQSRIRQAGESCTKPGDFCDPAKDLQCARRDKEGSRECIKEGTIDEGSLCDNSALCKDGLVCVEESCTPFKTVGKGEECDQERSFCEPGLACIGQREDDERRVGTCKDFAKGGDSCDTTRDCHPDFYCSYGGDATQMGTCEKLKQLGESCGTGKCSFELECATREIKGDSVCRYPARQSCNLPN